MIKYNKQRECCSAPVSVNISVTEKCPLRCPICFQKYNRTKELDFKKICEYIDELSLLGTSYVQFSGGEPLLYPYLFESIEYAKKKGMKTRIATSGVGLTQNIAESLVRAGLDYCHISLNGSKKAIHELSREGYEETLRALHILALTDLKVAINWVANHNNVEDLPKMVLLAKSLNVDYISILSLKTNNKNVISEQLTKKDYKKLVQYCNDYKDYLVVESCFQELIELLDNRKEISKGCRAGRFYMAIDVQGRFSPCPHIKIFCEKFSTILDYWNEDEQINMQRKWIKKSRMQENSKKRFTCFQQFENPIDTNILSETILSK